MFSLLLAIQTQVSGRPSGADYILTMVLAAVLGGILVAVITSRFNRPSDAEEKAGAPQVKSRAAVPQAPPQAKPEGVRR